MGKPVGVTILLRRVEKAGLVDILQAHASKARASLEELLAPGRSRRLSRARRAAWEELRRLDYSHPEIGRLFGRHHTTIMGGLESLSPRRKVPTDPGRFVACMRPRVAVCSVPASRFDCR